MEEEKKGEVEKHRESIASRATSSFSEEVYDSFDQNAQTGALTFDMLSALSTKIADTVNRRVTSQRLIEPSRLKQEAPKPKTGMLDKYSPALFAGWQSRKCTLENGIFKYFKEEKNGTFEMKGTLNFDLYACTVTKIDGKP